MISAELKVIVDNIEPYIAVREKDAHMKISGYMGDLWNIIELTLNFKCTYISTTFNIGKALLANGSVDVILVPVIVTITDVDSYDFSLPVADCWYELYVKKQGSDATSVSYLETWRPSLWIAFLLTILLLTLAVSTVLRIRNKFILDHRKKTELRKTEHITFLDKNRKTLMYPTYEKLSIYEDERSKFSTCFFLVLGSVANQGFRVNTKSTAMRLLILVTLFFGFVMFNSYSAVLVSRLAVGKPKILFPSLESIANRKTHTICVREQSFAFLLFKDHESDREVTSKWKNLVNQTPCRNVTRVEQIAAALCQDNTVILETPNIISTILESYRECVITKMPGKYASAYTSLLMRKQFPYTKEINEIIRKLTSSGIIDFLQRKWLSSKLPRSILAMSNNEPVTMSHIKGVLMVYGIAICISTLTFLLEKLTYWYKIDYQRKIPRTKYNKPCIRIT